MKILAIDSSGMPASAAVVEDGKLIAAYTVNYQKTHSQMNFLVRLNWIKQPWEQ